MKKRWTVIIIIIILVALIVVPMIINPIRRPRNMLRNHILRQTPIGTSMEDVIVFVDSNEAWGVQINYDIGLIYSGTPISEWPVTLTGHSIIGDMFIGVHMGNYGILPRMYAWVGWAFDAEGELIKVYVRKGVSHTW